MDPNLNNINMGQMPPQQQPPMPQQPNINPDLANVGEQGQIGVGDTGVNEKAMETLDRAITEISQSPDPVASIKALISELESLIGESSDDKAPEPKY